jgi:hypothetical protein
MAFQSSLERLKSRAQLMGERRMAEKLDPIYALVAEVVALRIVTKRLLARLGQASGDPEGFVRREHAQAMGDIERFSLEGAPPELILAVRGRAEQVLDELHTWILYAPPSPPPPAQD